jgi:conjugal transfer pilus assembly protein TraF
MFTRSFNKSSYWHLMKLFIFLLSLIVLTFPSYALDSQNTNKSSSKPIQTHDKGDDLGWNFYWDKEAEEKKQKEKEKAKAATATPSSQTEPQPKTLSTEWFQKHFDEIKERAIDSPNKENMRALLLTEKVMADKGEVFARKKRYYQSVLPDLQEGTRLPMTGAATVAFNSFKSGQRREALKEIATKAGLIFFYDHDCYQCAAMVPVINRMLRLEKQNVYVIAKNLKGQSIKRLDKKIPIIPDTGQSSAFKIKVWPAVVLARPPLDGLILSQGSVFYTELEKRMINIAFEANILNQDWYNRVYPEEKGLMSEQQLAGIPKDVADDPVKLINYLANIAANPEGIQLESTNIENSNP